MNLVEEMDNIIIKKNIIFTKIFQEIKTNVT